MLVIGDGMGITTLTAGRIFSGQQLGLNGEDFAMSFETLPYSALVKTYNTDLQTPDSAGTITALLTGTKTRAGVLSVGPGVTRGDCASGAGQTLDTLMD
ncbi:alkaline phosphatase, partial [Wenyingzhuangia sp. 1_MG-2023]|nr:alkaline phosphatase [Wenyingzhuangia sp. 1_MG-2023]